MLGTIVNALSVFVGSILGVVLKGGIPDRVSKTLMKGISLCVLYIGISSSLKGENFLLIIISVVIGAVIGELIDIDKLIKRLGDFIEGKLKGKGGKVSEGFVTTSLIFCVGAMAIVGSLESGLTGNHKTLFAKSILDGVSSVFFASSLGIGVFFSGFSVFAYQGLITILAQALKGVLATGVVNDLTAIGGLLIIGIGLNMLTDKNHVKVANLLPAVFMPIIYHAVMMLFS